MLLRLSHACVRAGVRGRGAARLVRTGGYSPLWSTVGRASCTGRLQEWGLADRRLLSSSRDGDDDAEEDEMTAKELLESDISAMMEENEEFQSARKELEDSGFKIIDNLCNEELIVMEKPLEDGPSATMLFNVTEVHSFRDSMPEDDTSEGYPFSFSVSKDGARTFVLEGNVGKAWNYGSSSEDFDSNEGGNDDNDDEEDEAPIILPERVRIESGVFNAENISEKALTGKGIPFDDLPDETKSVFEDILADYIQLDDIEKILAFAEWHRNVQIIKLLKEAKHCV